MRELLSYRKLFELMSVRTADSLNQFIERASRHYSSLFMLPPYKKVLSLLALTCVGGGVLSFVFLFPFQEVIVNGLLLGFSLFFANLFIDSVISMTILEPDPIYDVRRIAALSLFSWVVWFFFIFAGLPITMIAGLSWWVRFCLLGYSAAIVLRIITLFSTSSIEYKRLIVAALLQPVFCIIPFLIFWTRTSYPLPSSMVFILSLVVCLTSGLFFVHILNSVGKHELGVPSLPIFHAFLLNWIVESNAPFEEFLEKLGENRDVEVSLIKFCSSKPKAIITVPSIHPGPFKNVGSSLLPSMLKTALEKEFDCIAGVPHGLFGHEFDLASQAQNQKIINYVIESANFEVSESRATPFIKVSNGLATACCQVFGNFAFLSFTLAPKATEDLPQGLGLFVCQEARKHGLAYCVVVNAHNSIDGAIDIQEALAALKRVAVACLKEALSLERLPFEVGAATVVPKKYGLREGMGKGGVTVIVVKVEQQKTAYVVIDGNNMVSGLREKILSTLHSMGIDEGEVFTTDTHSVNALILKGRGYHPIGEAIDEKDLIKHIKEATFSALSGLEPVKASCRNVTVQDVKVIGEKLLEQLCLLIDKVLKKAKRIVVPIFTTCGLLLMLIFMFA